LLDDLASEGAAVEGDVVDAQDAEEPLRRVHHHYRPSEVTSR
jgi:hypothetical protein